MRVRSAHRTDSRRGRGRGEEGAGTHAHGGRVEPLEAREGALGDRERRGVAVGGGAARAEEPPRGGDELRRAGRGRGFVARGVVPGLRRRVARRVGIDARDAGRRKGDVGGARLRKGLRHGKERPRTARVGLGSGAEQRGDVGRRRLRRGEGGVERALRGGRVAREEQALDLAERRRFRRETVLREDGSERRSENDDQRDDPAAGCGGH